MVNIQKTIESFGLKDEILQLVFLSVRNATGGWTNCDLLAYRYLSNTVIDTINSEIEQLNNEQQFHVESQRIETKSFKNSDLHRLLEEITEEKFSIMFGSDCADSIIEQDEKVLNKILSENLSNEIGMQVTISLTGDIEKDTENLSDIVKLLLKRNVEELVSSMSETISVARINPWFAIEKNEWQADQSNESDTIYNDANKLIVNYVDNSKDNILDIDLIQQVSFVVGLLKKIKKKQYSEMALVKKNFNKIAIEETHKELPKEKVVYDIKPESIIKMKGVSLTDESLIDSGPQNSEDIELIQEDWRLAHQNKLRKNKIRKRKLFIKDNIDNKEQYKNNERNKGLLSSLKRVFLKKETNTRSSEEEIKEREKLIKELSQIERNFLTKGLIDNEQPENVILLKPNYEIISNNAFKDISKLEKILKGTLSNSDDVSSNYFNYTYSDVTEGIHVKLKWQSIKNNSDNDNDIKYNDLH